MLEDGVESEPSVELHHTHSNKVSVKNIQGNSKKQEKKPEVEKVEPVKIPEPKIKSVEHIDEKPKSKKMTVMKTKKDDEMEKWENEVLNDASNQAVLAPTSKNTAAKSKSKEAKSTSDVKPPAPAPKAPVAVAAEPEPISIADEDDDQDEEEKTKNTRAF